MEIINFQILKSDNLTINCDLRSIPENRKKPLVIFLHGFKSFRNWGFIPFCCEFFAKNGFMVINFDYSMNGIIDSEKSIFDTEIFARQTISSHLNDFIYLIEKIKAKDIVINDYLARYWNNQVFTIGHSMGGAISLLGYDKVRQDKIVLWATISQIDRNTERQKQIWKEKGYTEIKIMPSEQILHLNYSYIEDKEKIHQFLLDIQDRLFSIGSHLATDASKMEKVKDMLPSLFDEDILVLEKAIDEMEEHLEPMKFFVLPGGHPLVSHCHIARCICRRSERNVVRYSRHHNTIDPHILPYLNRLSDYLFVLSRYITKLLGAPEFPWIPKRQ